MDVRYYAITSNGRSRIIAGNLEEARRMVEASPYLNERTLRIVRETREEFARK
jgi:hypothetical protein